MKKTTNHQMLDIIESWQIPPIGCRSAAAVPSWLVERWMHGGDVYFNGYGGLSVSLPDGELILYPEDWVHLMADQKIQFCPSVATLLAA